MKGYCHLRISPSALGCYLQSILINIISKFDHEDRKKIQEKRE